MKNIYLLALCQNGLCDRPLKLRGHMVTAVTCDRLFVNNP